MLLQEIYEKRNQPQSGKSGRKGVEKLINWSEFQESRWECPDPEQGA